MCVLGPRIPVAIYLYREDPSITREALRRRSAPAIAKRRSVSSMKDLMPLSLPKLRSSIPNNEDIQENMNDDLDSCFPELLARDLELSSSVFESKNMTSGTPSISLIQEEKNKQRTMSCPGRVLTSPYQTASLRVQTLGAIEERDSVVSFLDRRDYTTEATSDVDSLPGTESSGGLEGPLVRFRQQSIMTAATSLTSASGSAPSPKDLMVDCPSRDHSWIDVDSDDGLDMDMEDGGAPAEKLAALSPRPPSPLISDTPLEINETLQEFPIPRTAPPQTHLSMSGGLSRQNSLRSIDIPPRRASLCCSMTPTNIYTRPESPCPKSKSDSRKKRLSLNLPSHARYLYQIEPYPNPSPPPEKVGFDTDVMDQYDDDSIFDGDFKPLQRPSTVYIQTTPPPSPLPTVQAWLDRSGPSFDSQPPVDDLAKAVPLPPDIIETLRVSIACFPETMLLSSSLTVETIRAYSKKLRHPTTDAWRESITAIPPQHHRRSLWKKVVSHGRESLHTYLHRTHLHNDETEDETSREVPVCPDAWASMRHVFGTCSDYICDALYAHIVAYNYISRVPRSQPPSSHRVSTSSSRKSQSDDIPKKAASLLGLDAPQRPIPNNPNVGRIAKKFSTPLTWSFGKDEMTVGGGTSSTAHDNATRNIEAGLLRCIVRLIATAKMMVEEGSGEERLMEVDPQEFDMIFVRSLCEIVRISEEAMVTAA